LAVVAEGVGNDTEGDGLLDGEAGWEAAEPPGGAAKGGAAGDVGVVLVEGSGELECAPGGAVDGRGGDRAPACGDCMRD
jgi:hypothetical protein